MAKCNPAAGNLPVNSGKSRAMYPALLMAAIQRPYNGLP